MRSLPLSVVRWLIAAAMVAGVLQTGPVSAQEYSFRVPDMKMQVGVQEDASAHIAYDITFANNGGAHVIDVVDIGVPHERYSISNMSASIDGSAVTDIRHSDFVKPGVEVHLGSHAIPAGGEGAFHFEFTMPDMVYQDTTRKDYASLQITPTWFGSRYATGTTDLQVDFVYARDNWAAMADGTRVPSVPSPSDSDPTSSSTPGPANGAASNAAATSSDATLPNP